MPQFRCRAFVGHLHPSYLHGAVVIGCLAIETVHSCELSAAVEIEAMQELMRRGHYGRAELIDCRPGGKLTCLRVYADTKVAWSWVK